jgi:integrase
MAALTAYRAGGGAPSTVAEALEVLDQEQERMAQLMPRTQAQYREVLRRFRLELADEAGHDFPDPRAAAVRMINSFPPSRRHVPSGLARRMGIRVAKVRQVATVPRPLTPELWRRIVATFRDDIPAPETGGHHGHHREEIIWRDRAACLLIALTGLRPGDVASAKVHGWNRPTLHLLQKGGRPRIVTVPELAGAAIDDYLLHRRPAPGVTALWLGYDNSREHHGRPVASAALSASIRRRADVKRLPTFQLRQLRSTVATLLARDGSGPYLVAGVMGHQSLATAQHYIDPSNGQAEGVHRLERLLTEAPVCASPPYPLRAQ